MKIINLVFAFLLATSAFSQSENAMTEKKVKFGFNLGANYSNLKTNSDLPSNTTISNGAGVTMGLIMDYALSNHFHISPKTELSFNQSKVEMKSLEQPGFTYKVYPVTLDIMTHAYYKIGHNTSGPYVLAGPNFRIPVKDKSNSENQFKSNSDFAVDFGIGFDFVNRFFTIAPELRYSYGMLNVSGDPQIPNLNYNKITLVVNFK